VTGALLGLGGVVLVGTTGLIVARTLRVRGASCVILAAYVLAFAEVVGLSLLLSMFDALTRTGLITGCIIGLVGALAAWLVAGRPELVTGGRVSLGFAGNPQAHVVLATVVALALAYVVALIIGTPPNGWDRLNYHLTRAALWLQAGHVGYIDHAYDQRLNFNPPNGEIGFTFVLALTRDENFAGFVQFAAALACSAGVFAFSRRIGLTREQAAFGALLFLTLPIVLLQSPGVKNDVIVASFLVAAAVFLVGRTRGDMAIAAIATALAVGTKFIAVQGLVLLLAIAIFAGTTCRARRVLSVAIGASVGAYWYFVNAVETHSLLGDQSNTPGLTALLHPRENLLNAYGLAVDLLDVSGARGRDILLYLVAAVLITLVVVWSGATRRSAAAAGLLMASPLAILVIAEFLGDRGLRSVYDWLGEPQAYIAAGDAVASSPTTASDTGSWFGPAGFWLVAGLAVVGVVAARRARLSRIGQIAALAPALWFVLLALTLTYNPWEGRFFIFPVALSASLWGLVLRSPPLAWSVVGLASITAGLSLVHYAEKPSGLRLLDRTESGSVWKMDRSEIQSLHSPPVGPLFRFLDESIPRGSGIGLALGANEFGYPTFGPQLRRRVILVPTGSNGRDVDANWLETDRSRATEIDRTCWSEVFQSETGSVFRRMPSCAATQ
jgi:hypothetical protein